MNDKVIKLGKTTLPDEPHGDLIETLEGLLAEAREGGLRAMAYATVRQNGETGSGWDGADGTRYRLHSAISMLSHRYTLRALEGGISD